MRQITFEQKTKLGGGQDGTVYTCQMKGVDSVFALKEVCIWRAAKHLREIAIC